MSTARRATFRSPIFRSPASASKPGATAMDLAAIIGGPNPAFPSSSAYSPAHYRRSRPIRSCALADYRTYVFDSLTAMSRLSASIASKCAKRSPTGASATFARSSACSPATCSAGCASPSRPRPQHHLRRDPRAGDGRDQHRDLATAVRGPEDGARTARDRRRNHHHDLDRFRRRQAAGARLRMHVPQCVELSRERPGGQLAQIEPPDLGKLLAKITSFTSSTTSSTKGE